MSTAAARSGDPTPAKALPPPLPESLSQPGEISSRVVRSRRYDASFLVLLAGIQLAWLAVLAVVILAFVR